ncbi:MAG: CrcB family protein [Bifidobacteriaceae bacterium]|jgi:CrcB protein|nr:CrcB family protein [Bifidobacteriaceae bacterium]
MKNWIFEILVVGIGGFLGAVARFIITKLSNTMMASPTLGTLISNIVAGFLIGLLIGFERHNGAIADKTKLFLTVGCLGGLSTFSAFSLQTFLYIENGNYIKAGLNTLLNVILSIGFVFIGILVANLIKKFAISR